MANAPRTKRSGINFLSLEQSFFSSRKYPRNGWTWDRKYQCQITSSRLSLSSFNISESRHWSFIPTGFLLILLQVTIEFFIFTPVVKYLSYRINIFMHIFINYISKMTILSGIDGFRLLPHCWWGGTWDLSVYERIRKKHDYKTSGNLYLKIKIKSVSEGLYRKSWDMI